MLKATDTDRSPSYNKAMRYEQSLKHSILPGCDKEGLWLGYNISDLANN